MQSNILPRIEARSAVESEALAARAAGASSWQALGKPFASHFWLSLGEDLSDSIRPLSVEDLANVRFDDALEQALAELRRRSTPDFQELAPGLFCSPWRDGFDASRLLLTGLLRELPVRGDLIAMAPNRDVLLVAGSEQPEALDRLTRVATAALGQPNALIGIALKLSGEVWETWLPPLDHPSRNDFALLHNLFWAASYERIKPSLEDWLDSRDEDCFVAKYQATQHEKTGAVSSFCAYSEGVPSLLPKAERIVFMKDAGGEPRLAADVPWDRAAAALGADLESYDQYPGYFRTHGFPTPERLAAMTRG